MVNIAKKTWKDRGRIFARKVKELITNADSKSGYLIAGGDNFGLSLATILKEDNRVIIIEEDKKLAEEIANRTDFLVINGDPVDINILNEAGLHEVEAFIAATSNDKTNLMACHIAKAAKVRKIISLVNSPQNEALFTNTEGIRVISKVGSAVAETSNIIKQITNERILNLIGTQAQIVEIPIRKNSRFIGEIIEIDNAVVVAIIRNEGTKIIIPPKDEVIKENDLIVIAAKTKVIHSIINLFSEE